MATTLNVGQKLPLSIAYLDQNGNPMSPPPTPDSPPAWSSSNPAAATLAAAPDGNSAVETGVAAGVDVVSLSVTVAGQTFAAQLSVTVTQVVQVLTSVEIVPGTPA